MFCSKIDVTNCTHMIINQTIENISENIGWVLFKLDAEHYEQQVWVSSSTYCICSKSNIFCSMQLGTGNKSVDMATSQWLSFCALLSDVHYCRCQVIHYSFITSDSITLTPSIF